MNNDPKAALNSASFATAALISEGLIIGKSSYFSFGASLFH